VICALTTVVKLNGSVESVWSLYRVGRKRGFGSPWDEGEATIYDSTGNRRGQTTAFTTAGNLQLDMLPNQH